jgi:hypothetical protein
MQVERRQVTAGDLEVEETGSRLRPLGHARSVPGGMQSRILGQIASVLGASGRGFTLLWQATWKERATGELTGYVQGICERLDLRRMPEQLNCVLEIRTRAHSHTSSFRVTMPCQRSVTSVRSGFLPRW